MKYLIFLFFIIPVYSQSQTKVSRIDVKDTNLENDKALAARSIYRLIEFNNLEMVSQFLKDSTDLVKLKHFVNQLDEMNLLVRGIPTLFYDTTGQKENSYSRIYYSKSPDKNHFLFEVEIFFGQNQFDLRAESIKIYRKDEADRFLKMLEQIDCGAMPPGPPATGSFVGFNNKSIRRPLKRIVCDGGNLAEKIDGIDKTFGYDIALRIAGPTQEDLDSSIIWNTKSIINLSISGDMHGRITSLPSEIGNLTNLEELYIYCSNIKSIPNQIGRLKKLKKLTLIVKNCIGIPEEIGHLIELEELEISGDFLSLPDQIGNLKKLKRLKLNCNKLLSLPENLDSLNNLKTLRLITPELLSLPSSIGKANNLEYIFFIGTNKLKYLPEEFSEIDSIKFIEFGHVSKIPLPKKKLLNLNEIEIRNVDNIDNIAHYKSLKILSIRDGSFTGLPENFGELSFLNQLKFFNCDKISTLPESIKNCSALSELISYQSGLEWLPEGFINLNNLTKIRITSNSLRGLPSKIGQLQKLEKVDLSRNQIKKLPPSITELTQCEEFRLNANNINSIPDEVLNYKGKSKMTLYLKGNPIEMDNLEFDSSIKIKM